MWLRMTIVAAPMVVLSSCAVVEPTVADTTSTRIVEPTAGIQLQARTGETADSAFRSDAGGDLIDGSSSATPTVPAAPTALTAETLDEGWSLAAKADQPLEVYESPDLDEYLLTLAPHTDLGSTRVVRVISGPSDGWMEVMLPIRPNGSTGWIRSAAVSLFTVDRRVEVDLSDHRLEVLSPQGTLLRTEVAVGGTGSPTPVGSFFVTDSVFLTDPTGPWGPHAFGLSAYSDTITEFNGGDGIIGIHGTNRPESIGGNRSLGCVRVPNEVAFDLSNLLSAGVPVEIVR